uniref:Uncharacterized protein n=1 Tax=Chromera velia CCMP2878 TaxID=1169474 RepID=A0A0G4GHL5_9ALVE|eukprot:Cvel_21912.t1-p1 / transcript=Cvel_21912.t1 / gene=Cvel_21912 / organism=Chromera_velia_CCMP2878 / gene_product=hypothetical protein / transcript_product=hypothetical protein / location=Cvel_scaffold2100:5815-10116(+) / protein_length=233 / sequence_SO=supercontig / SO=protein_coding / is_pseudo=false
MFGGGSPFCCCAGNTVTKNELLVHARAVNPAPEAHAEGSPGLDSGSPPSEATPQLRFEAAESPAGNAEVRIDTTSSGAVAHSGNQLSEKKKLQSTIKEIAKDAVKGIRLELVDPETCDREDVSFSVDGKLKTVTVKATCPVARTVPSTRVTVDVTQFPLLSTIEHEGFFISLSFDAGGSAGSPKSHIILFSPSKELAHKVYIFLKVIKLSFGQNEGPPGPVMGSPAGLSSTSL